MSAHRLVLDPTRCTGELLCAELVPELVDVDDWGYPVVNREEVPSSLRAHARRAASACPALALRLKRTR